MCLVRVFIYNNRYNRVQSVVYFFSHILFFMFECFLCGGNAHTDPHCMQPLYLSFSRLSLCYAAYTSCIVQCVGHFVSLSSICYIALSVVKLSV